MPRTFPWPAPPSDSAFVTLLLRIPPDRIGLFTALLEAYEGVSISRTRNQATGEVEVWVMPGQRPVIEGLLDDLRREFPILLLREEAGHPDLTTVPVPDRGVSAPVSPTSSSR